MRTRQVRAVSEIEIFMSQHWSTMVTVYIIGAAVTFVLTFVIFWMLERQSEKEERENQELLNECGIYFCTGIYFFKLA